MIKASKRQASVYKGRGATLSPANRFSPRQSEWDEEPEGPSPVTECLRAGARDAAYILLRLPLETAELFLDWLRTHYPLRADHVMSLVRQSRGGQENDSRFGHRMRGTGTFADLLSQRFRVACKRMGLGRREQPELRTDLFQPPLDPAARRAGQFDLFTQ